MRSGAAASKQIHLYDLLLTLLYSKLYTGVTEDSPPFTTLTTAFDDFRWPSFLSYCSNWYS
jgi:hypothetical protein